MEDFIKKNRDLEKSFTKTFNKNINKKEFNFTNDDIEFLKSKSLINSDLSYISP